LVNKIFPGLDAAVAGIQDGATIMIGGFGNAGMPRELIDALIAQGASDLTIVNNNAGNGDTGLAALLAAGRGDNARKSEALTRALAALTALQMGLDPGQPITAALATFLESGRKAVLGSVVQFEPRAIERLREDVADLLEAFRHAPD